MWQSEDEQQYRPPMRPPLMAYSGWHDCMTYEVPFTLTASERYAMLPEHMKKRTGRSHCLVCGRSTSSLRATTCGGRECKLDLSKRERWNEWGRTLYTTALS